MEIGQKEKLIGVIFDPVLLAVFFLFIEPGLFIKGLISYQLFPDLIHFEVGWYQCVFHLRQLFVYFFHRLYFCCTEP